MKKLEKIENQIFKTGNIHSILNEIKILKKNKSQLAKNILKKQRRESLKELLRDEIKKNRIKIHAQSIIQRKKNSQARLLENEDFKPLLDAFPCWGVTTYAISQSIPLKPGLFDVVIIDEASQCDIASCFPLLFRAKKAVIVGDDKQLPHLSFLEKAKEQSYLAKYEIPDKYQLIWKFRTNSMFDLANYYSNSQVLLDEHFRSVPSIINFSNKMFYNDQIKVMKVENDETLALDLEIVENGKIEFGVTKNEIEIEALIKRLYQIIINDEKNEIPLTIGIISPFRAQVEALEKAVNFVLSPDLIKRHKIEIGTAHTFQGDEKDVILISWTYANNSYFQSLTFLQKPNLFNVAITRAKKQVISFISKDPKTLPKGLLKDYLENIIAHGEKKKLKQQFQNTDNIIDFKEYKNSFEKEIANKLRNEGYVVEPNFEIASLNCDLLVKNKENKTIVIEIDGFEDKIKEKIKNIKKQTLIERSGFKVVRVTYREWYYCEKAVLNRIYDSF